MLQAHEIISKISVNPRQDKSRRRKKHHHMKVKAWLWQDTGRELFIREDNYINLTHFTIKYCKFDVNEFLNVCPCFAKEKKKDYWGKKCTGGICRCSQHAVFLSARQFTKVIQTTAISRTIGILFFRWKLGYFAAMKQIKQAPPGYEIEFQGLSQSLWHQQTKSISLGYHSHKRDFRTKNSICKLAVVCMLYIFSKNDLDVLLLYF